MQPSSQPRWLWLAPWLFVLIWSAGYSFAKIALESTTPLNLLAYRFVASVAVLLPFFVFIHPARPSLIAVRDIMVVAFFLQIVHFLSVYLGLFLGASAGVLALFSALQPALIITVASMVQRSLPSVRIWLGLIAGIVGATWTIYFRGQLSDAALLGSFMGFVAIVGFSIGTVYNKLHRPQCHPLWNYTIQYAFASLFSLPFAWWLEGFAVEFSTSFVGAMLFLVLGNSLFGIYLLLTMVRYGRVDRVSSIMFLVPAVAAIWAYYLIDEVMPVLALPGMVLAAVAVILVLYAPESKKGI